MVIANIISFIILLIGGINWGLVGIFNFNLVDWIFGGYNAGSIIVYILVLISAIWLIISACMRRSIILNSSREKKKITSLNFGFLPKRKRLVFLFFLLCKSDCALARSAQGDDGRGCRR